MKFVELKEEEFMEFVNSRPEKNFFQTIKMFNRLKKEGTEVYLVGVKDKKKVVAASLIAATGQKFMGKKAYEAYKGFVMDYSDKSLVKFMTGEVSRFLKEKNALKLIIDPYIVNVSRDADANIVDGVDNREIKTYLESLGYKYNEHGAQVKWTYCLDIDGKSTDELMKDMRGSTKTHIKKTISKFKLDIRTLSKEDLPEFKKITSDTCDRRHFADKSLEYYQDMYDAFGDEITFKICDLNCDTYLEVLNNEISEYEEKIERLVDNESNKKKKEQMRESILSNKKKVEEVTKLKEEKGNIIPLSAAMFILYGDEICYMFSGSYEEYMPYYGQYAIQWDIIKYAVEHGYKRYNFMGIHDVFNPDGKDYGVYWFKKGFGGYVEELLGTFELSLSPANRLYECLRGIKKIIKK